MSEPIVLTPNENRVVELLRALKANKGHGTLRVDIADGLEILFRPEFSEKPGKPRC